MKTIIFCCTVILCLSCKPAMTAQENNKKDTTMTVQKPKYEDSFKEQVIPNTIHFKGKIVSIETGPIDICGNSFKDVAVVEVLDVTTKGSGLINAFNNEATLKFVFFMGFDRVEKDGKIIFKGLKKGETFKGIAHEKLCVDIKQTYYSINTYE